VFYNQKATFARHWWLKPAIPATWEANIRNIMIQSQPPANNTSNPVSKTPITKKGLVERLQQ
jgi:hypothetical protein